MQFTVFRHAPGESLTNILTRFYQLMSDLDNNKVAYTENEKVSKLLDALPSSWEAHNLMLKADSPKYAKYTIEEIVGKLRAYEFDKQKREITYEQVQSTVNKVVGGSSGGVNAFLTSHSEGGGYPEVGGSAFVASTNNEESSKNYSRATRNADECEITR